MPYTAVGQRKAITVPYTAVGQREAITVPYTAVGQRKAITVPYTAVGQRKAITRRSAITVPWVKTAHPPPTHVAKKYKLFRRKKKSSHSDSQLVLQKGQGHCNWHEQVD